MSTAFLHGTETVLIEDGARPVRLARSGVIGLIGTAPDADEDKFPLNTPVLVTNLREADPLKAATGRPTGTLYHALQLIYMQARAAVVVVRVAEGEGADDAAKRLATFTNVVGSTSGGNYTGMNAFIGAKANLGVAPRVLIAPGFTGDRPQGVSAITLSAKGSGYTSAPTVTFTGGGGSGAAATAVLTGGITSATVGAGGTDYTAATVAFSGGGGTGAAGTVTVSGGAVTGITITNPGSGYTGTPTATISGDGTGATATPVVTNIVGSVTITNGGWGFTSAPTIGFTGGGGTGAAATATVAATGNPVGAALSGMADRLRAIAVVDGPSTSDADAITARQDYGNKRVYFIDPGVKALLAGDTSPQNYAASSVVAGVIARTDSDKGFWWSPSNQHINGITGLSRFVDFTLGESESRANILNEAEVATIIREDGFRLWGNRTCSADPQWAFLSVVRTADLIADSLMLAHLWAVDRCINRGYITAVKGSVEGYLRHLRGIGAILGGSVWVDETLNTPEVIAAGQVYFDFDFTPPFPAERVTFRAHLTNEYVREVLPPAA